MYRLGGLGRAHAAAMRALLDRTLLTLFTVSAVPDHSAEQEATANVTYMSGANGGVRVSLSGEAAPAGQGEHRGAFYLGAQSDLLQTDSMPDAG